MITQRQNHYVISRQPLAPQRRSYGLHPLLLFIYFSATALCVMCVYLKLNATLSLVAGVCLLFRINFHLEMISRIREGCKSVIAFRETSDFSPFRSARLKQYKLDGQFGLPLLAPTILMALAFWFFTIAKCFGAW